MFIDEIKVTARAGHGGKGCVSFLREAFRPKGGPNGGNGGRGGHVVLEANKDINSLVAQYYKPILAADQGDHGMGKDKDGKAGQDLVVKVPCGTLVWQLESPANKGTPAAEGSESTEEKGPLPSGNRRRPRIHYAGSEVAMEWDLDDPESVAKGATRSTGDQRVKLVKDLTEPGDRVILCRGGRGGLGNRNFATATRRTPRFAQPGEPGGEGKFLLELRLIADVGLVGFPNAGKSTLLSATSEAHPKVAPYPFTTLHPHLGIVQYPDHHRVTVCDIPGLVEGAHRNVGLGHAFLRHIERCRGLAVILDMAGMDGRQPWDDYQQILNELELHNPDLLSRPRMVVANKSDQAVAASNLRKFRRRNPGLSVISVAAALDVGLDRFRRAIRQLTETSG